jgi:hypothetical protein
MFPSNKNLEALKNRASNKEKNMTEHVTNEIDQNGPLGYQIKETVTTTGYVDDDGKFVPVDEVQKTEAVTYVQDEEDAIQV